MKLHFALIASLLTIFYACGSRGSSSGAGSVSDSDSVAPLHTERVAVERLPDTAYTSAENVVFNVEVVDSSVDGRIESLDDLYADAPGQFTFRGGQMRQANFNGAVKGVPSSINVEWTFRTQEDYTPTSVGAWGGGTGWTGQPLFVEWPDSVHKKMVASGAIFADASKQEIMVGSLYGSVYFIDFQSGKASREAIPVGNPIKGTVSLDPTLNGNLYVGQGAPARRPFGALAIDLFTNKQFDFFPEDAKARRRWGAYDSSPVRLGDFLFRPAENGGVYKLSVGPGSLKLHSVLRYTVKGTAPGIESSMAIYANYGFVADNHGNIIAINLDNMKPVWHYSLADDIDATPVVAVEDGVPYLYVGCEIDLQDAGSAKFVKLDARNGAEQWVAKIEGRRKNIEKKHFDGGFYASPLLGEGNCSGLIFSNCVKNTDGQNGAFVAMDRATGKIVYETKLKYYAWSSPVGFLNEKGEMFVVTGDCTGNLYIINGVSGAIIASQRIGANFESSPVVVGNKLVVGSRGNSIFKISID